MSSPPALCHTSPVSTRPPPPLSPLFPSTTLFRSPRADRWHRPRHRPRREGRGDRQRSRASRDPGRDRKSTRLNSSHVAISYAVFCLKKKAESPGEEEIILPDVS